jgi:hypothetical protein
MLGAFEFHQTLKVGEDDHPATAVTFKDALYYLPNAIVVQHSIDKAQAEELLSFTPKLFGGLHSALAPLFSLMPPSA